MIADVSKECNNHYGKINWYIYFFMQDDLIMFVIIRTIKLSLVISVKGLHQKILYDTN